MRAPCWLLAAFLFAIACRNNPVQWSDISYSGVANADSVTSLLLVPDSSACRHSAREAAGAGLERSVAWWSVRSDSSSTLMFASTHDGQWTPAVRVDTTDASRRGCARPAPSITVDSSSGNVYIAYFLEQTAGPGAFFTHSMDSTGFHDPVSVAYGKRPSETSIAVSGEKVAVAFEEPNAERGQIWVAHSASMGHIFEVREAISSSNEISRAPRIRFSGTKLNAEWSELIQSGSTGRSRRASRIGTWK